VNAACAFAVTCVLVLAAHAEQAGDGGHMAERAADTTDPAVDKAEDLAEISRELENPLTSLWSLTFEKTISIDWKADDGEELTFPVGLVFTKMAQFGKIP